MRNKTPESENTKDILGDALSIKSNEAHQSYLNDLKELEEMFKDILKERSFTIELDSKTTQNYLGA